MIVLGYITNEVRKFRTFVENRVVIIRRLTNIENWRHVSSEDNPADLLTRPSALSKDQINDLLWI